MNHREEPVVMEIEILNDKGGAKFTLPDLPIGKHKLYTHPPEDVRERELAAAQADAERYRWLCKTLQSAKGGAYVNVNERLGYYEKPEIGKEVAIQWYPITPIGFYISEGSTLDAAIDAAMKECGK